MLKLMTRPLLLNQWVILGLLLSTNAFSILACLSCNNPGYFNAKIFEFSPNLTDPNAENSYADFPCSFGGEGCVGAIRF